MASVRKNKTNQARSAKSPKGLDPTLEADPFKIDECTAPLSEKEILKLRPADEVFSELGIKDASINRRNRKKPEC